MSEYTFYQVNAREFHGHLMPLYCLHYDEMQARLAADGIDIPEFKPRLGVYFPAADAGNLITFIVVHDEKIVGYSNIWLTNDMHNGEYIAQEDTIYIVKEHRNGVGKRLVKRILADLEKRGVKRVHITPVTDLRVAKIWKRMGFKPASELMIYSFEDNANVRT